MISRAIGRRARWRAAFFLLLAVIGGGLRADFVPVAAPQFAKPTSPAKAAKPAAPEADLLVYQDGERLRGHFVRREGDVIVFQSERFGQLRAPAQGAEVILAKPPPAALAAVAPKAAEPDEEAESDARWPFPTREVARVVKQVFGNWHGRFAVATEMMQDGSQHENGSIEGRVKRKWKRDEVEINGRYDYASVNNVSSTDMVKADGLWRHTLSRTTFSLYRPTLEWNRAYYRSGVPSDYVLLQQEVGAGFSLFSTDSRKLRVGVSENLFDVWVTPLPVQQHRGQNVESVFAEVEAKLPWRVTLTDRGVYYYSITDGSDGWENRVELNKKLTETLSLGFRHEVRRNNPDVRSADYRRMRVLLGFDF